MSAPIKRSRSGKLAEQVIQTTGSSSEIQCVPYDTVYPEGFEDMQRRLPDVSKLERVTGFRPMRSLQQIIDDIVAEMTRPVPA